MAKCISTFLLPYSQIWLTFQCHQELFPHLSNIQFVKPLLKKTTLDPELLVNYRPVSNLSFASKLLVKVVAIWLNQYKDSNSLPKYLNLLIGFSIAQRLLFSKSRMVYSWQLTGVNAAYWLCWTCQLHLTLWTTKFCCKGYAINLVWMALHVTGWPHICTTGNRKFLSVTSYLLRLP